MESISNYLDFIKVNGRRTSEVNPGSDEYALTVNYALYRLELLKNSRIGILGGDIFSEENGQLIYAYQLWGTEYQYLNWYCDRIDSETKDDYLKRSYEIAKQGIVNANIIAEQFARNVSLYL